MNATHDHSWAEDMSEVEALCPDYNPQLAELGYRCPGDPPPIANTQQVSDMSTWYFTLGFGQTLKAHRASSDQADGAGIPLDNCYVRIEGTAESSRAVMVDLFGATWCGQYSEFPDVDGQPMCDLTALVELATVTREHQRRMSAAAPPPG